jgi:hypothetical protein
VKLRRAKQITSSNSKSQITNHKFQINSKSHITSSNKFQNTNLKSQRIKLKIQNSHLRSSTAIAFGGGSEASAGEANHKFQFKISNYKSQVPNKFQNTILKFQRTKTQNPKLHLRSSTAIAFGGGSEASAGEAGSVFDVLLWNLDPGTCILFVAFLWNFVFFIWILEFGTWNFLLVQPYPHQRQ